MPGKVLGGRYQVQDKIGTGGMATVFRGTDEVLGRTVAIKMMLPQYATDPSFAARFKQEAQAAAALQSPYIVSVYDWGKDAQSDTYYIVMEYLRGTDLKSGIRKHGALDCKKVAQIGSQIAQALSVAHRHDIIHRDIKPQNIMVQPDGNIKVMDFGIARAKNSHLTTDNSVLGTAHYVSPEQTQGKPLGPTTDIYSLGIVMYEAVTGQVPFQGDDAISVALKQVNEQPKPPSQLNPAVDPSLESIILRCMQKDPAARFQTADELYRVLRDYLAGRMQAVNNATAMIPVQATSKLDRAGAQGVAPVAGGTAAMPRVSAEGRRRPQSATEQAASEEEARRRKRTRNVVLGVVAGIAVVAALVYALVTFLGSGAKSVAVPDLANKTQDEAVQMLEDLGLVAQSSEDWSDTVAEGLVVSQNPAAGRSLPEGTTVSFVVSKGPEPKNSVTVPDLTGKSPSDAQALLKQMGLVGEIGEERESDDIDAGLVCDQDVKAGTSVDEGSTVTFYISKGAAQVVVPNVVGDTESDARSRLSDFTVNVTYDYSDSYDKGVVMQVTPSAGSSAEKGSAVTIVVSNGPKPISIPNVVGLPYSSAKSQLEALGFKVQLASGSSSSDGTVVSQSHTGSAAAGTTITLTTQKASTGDTGNGGETDGGTSGNGSQTGDTGTDGTSNNNG